MKTLEDIIFNTAYNRVNRHGKYIYMDSKKRKQQTLNNAFCSLSDGYHTLDTFTASNSLFNNADSVQDKLFYRKYGNKYIFTFLADVLY